MNRDRIEGGGKQFGGQLKEQWGRLYRDPEFELAGQRDQIAGRVLQRCGISNGRAARQLHDFLDRNRDWNPSNQPLGNP